MTSMTVPGSDLRGYGRILRRRRATFLLVFLLVAGAVIAALVVQPPTYVASTRILLETDGTFTPDAVLQQLLVGEREAVTQREIVLSDPVLTQAADEAGVDADVVDLRRRVGVTLIDETAVLEISASSSVAPDAAALATAVAESYLEYSRVEALDRLVRAARAVEEREAAAQERLADVDADLATASDGSSEQQSLLFERQQVLAEIAGLRQQRTALTATADEVGGIGRVVRDATVPDSHSGQQVPQIVAVAIALGLAAGLGATFLREYLDDRVRTADQVITATGQPILAQIGTFPRRADGIGLVDNQSEAAEGYRILRSSIAATSINGAGQSLVVTGATADEGVSTTAANLAAALARSGKRTMLVDTNLRNPGIGDRFGISGPGLSDVLIGDATVREVAQRVGIDNLAVIPAGTSVPNPAELLSSARMTDVIRQLEALADVVILDGSPALASADAVEVVRHVGRAVLVVDAKKATRTTLAQTIDRLSAAPAGIAGVVVNRTSERQPHVVVAPQPRKLVRQ